MNMKTTKFLAVLAVLAMAFAAFAVIAPAMSSDAATATVAEANQISDSQDITDNSSYYVYYDSKKTTPVKDIVLTYKGDAGQKGVKIYILPTTAITDFTVEVKGDNTAALGPVTIYVASGVEGTTVTYDSTYVVKFAKEAASTNSTGKMSVTSAPSISAPNAGVTLTTTTAYTKDDTNRTYVMSGTNVELKTGESFVIPKDADEKITFTGSVKGATGTVALSGVVAKTTDITFKFADTEMDVIPTVGTVVVESGSFKSKVDPTAAGAIITGVSPAALGANAILYATIADALAHETTLKSGTSVLLGNFTMKANTTIAENFTLAAASSLTIPDRYTLTIDQANSTTPGTSKIFTVPATGKVVVYGKLLGVSYTTTVSNATTTTYPTIDPAAGTDYGIFLKPGSTLYGVYCDSAKIANIGDASADDASITDSYVVNEDTTVTNLVVKGTLTVAKGVTLTVKGSLVVTDMVINGKLIVTNTGSIGKINGAAVSAFKATIGEKGSIENDGVIGKNFAITYTTDAANNYVETAGVSGVSVKYSTNGPLVTGTAKAESKPFIGGQASATAALIDPYVDVKAAAIGKLSIPSGVIFKTTTTASKVTGALTIASDWTTTVGITVVAGGSITSTGAMIGAITLGVAEEDYKTTAPTSGATITISTAAVSGFTVKVVKETVVVDDETTYYNYRAYLSGVLVASEAAGLTVTGIVWVDETLSIPSAVTVTAAAPAGFAVTGKIISTKDLKSAVVFGATYSVTDDSTAVFYAVAVDEGLEALSIADNKTVTLNGQIPAKEYEKYLFVLLDDFVVLTGETLDYEGSTPILYIPEGVKMGVQASATFNAGALKFIDGSLVVYTGATCNPDPAIYDVTYSNTEFTVYCGFQTALDEAQPGDTIVFTNSKTFAEKNYMENLTIPEGVTLEIAGTIEVLKTVTVSKDALLEVTGNLNIGSDGTNVPAVSGVRFNVIGEADLTGGSTVITGKSTTAPANIYSVGKLAYTSSTFTYATTNAILNGFVYFDTNYVMTDLASAVLSEKAITAYGEVADLTAVELAANLTVETDAKIILGIVAIDGYTVTAKGELTATLTGTDLLGEDAAIVVSEFTGTISDLKSTSDVYTMKISAFSAGDLAVTAGSVAIAGSFTGDSIATSEDSLLYTDSSSAVYTISTESQMYLGDILLSKGELTLEGKEGIIIGGLVTISDVSSLTINATVDGTVVVGGNILVAGEFTNYEDMLLTGTIAVDDSEDSVASATTYGTIVMGTPELAAQGTITGKLVVNNTYLLMFPGASVSLETLATAKNVSDVYVNGDLYCTIATNKTDLKLDGLITKLKITAEGYDMSGQDDIENWTDEDGDELSATDVVGKVDAYFNGSLIEIKIHTSWVKGLSLYIEGVRVTASEVKLTMGIYSVSATVDAGYACDNMAITFNGIAVPITKEGAIITITVDDAGSALAVTGDVYIPEPEPVTPEEKSEWTITTILLVILVILIAVMAVIVALRLNRS